jgi:poly(hydroxyalkanoate) granule-associated protein
MRYNHCVWRHKMEEEKSKENNEKHEYHSFYDVMRRMMLAGIGAIALKHDEVEEFIDKLVERGELAKNDAEELRNEMKERRKKYFHGEESHLHNRMQDFLNRLEVPTKEDINLLNKKMTELEKKIDKLTKAKE